ncbi:MAG TPA: hypothetical protein VFD55_00725, partial [Candidatus Angelobacter sp.]|nr:hypothetical protein [Candidatus Angelobacter sp.]
ELQNRLATELQDRAKERAKLTDRPDGVDDSQYIKGTEKTSSLAWVWVVIILLAIGIIVWLTVLSMAR